MGGVWDQLTNGVPWEVGTVLVSLYLMTCFQVGLASLWSRKQLHLLNSFPSAASVMGPLGLNVEMFSYESIKKCRKRQVAFFVFDLMSSGN